MNEPGPFIMIGSMDGGPDRVYQYALEHPHNVVAVVSAAISGGPSEVSAVTTTFTHI